MAKPFCLHPENPHIFLFRDEPTLLITSAEHYGALLNTDFDYEIYLDTLARDGMNHTRTFSGAYCEPEGAFNISRNTLAPAPERFLAPWPRSNTPGYANAGNKFDLSGWSDAYFIRLHDFMKKASDCGVVIELNLFCPFYKDDMWELSPMNARNNVNDVGDGPSETVYRLDRDDALLDIQESLVRKLVAELKGYDNLYYEVMNEPYARDVSMDWQLHMVDVISDAQADPTDKHLISMNVANGKSAVDNPHPDVSLLNFHYAWPSETIATNYELGRAIGDNETGFRGTGDAYYRREAWAFILAGGALYNNLDYSFVAGHEDGTFVYPDDQPGGGTRALRGQLRTLSEFIHSFDIVRMRPLPNAIGDLPEGFALYVMGDTGCEYAVYLCRTDDALASDVTPVAQTIELTLPAGTYEAEWVGVLWGGGRQSLTLDHEGGLLRLATPGFVNDIALGIRARG